MTALGYEVLIARRQFRALRRRRRAAVTARIASTGVGIGVAATVVVLSVMNGFSGLLWERLLALSPHVLVRPEQTEAFAPAEDLTARMLMLPGVAGAAPFVETQGYLMRLQGAGSAGVTVLGLDAQDLLATTDIGRYVRAGEVAFDPRASTEGNSGPGLLLGSYLADRLGASVGSEVRLGLPPADLGTGATPLLRRYVVSGIFQTDYPEFDGSVAFVSRSSAQKDLGWAAGMASGVRVRLFEPLNAEEAQGPIAALAGPGLGVSTWMDEHQNLYASIRLEKWSFYIGLSLIVVVAGFNIVSILAMNVAERRKDIGILKAMGATRTSIGTIFTLMGLRIGCTGVAAGSGAGILACWVQQTFEPLKLPGEVYIVNALPVTMRAWDFVLVSASAVALCYLFTLIPSREASSVDPVESIRS